MSTAEETKKTEKKDKPAESTELTTLQKSKFLALRPDSDIAEALVANLAEGEGITESDLTTVSTPAGGATVWTVEELEGDQQHKELTGVCVYYGRGGTLWPSNDPVEGTLPYLRTDNLVTAYKVGDDMGDLDPEELKKCVLEPGTYDWEKLSYNQFGSGKNGVGKRCQEYRVICLLREEDSFPLLIRAKPGSLKNIVPWIKKLPVPHYRAVLTLSLEEAKNEAGQKFARIVPTLASKLSKEEGVVVKQTYTDNLAKAIRNSDAD